MMKPKKIFKTKAAELSEEMGWTEYYTKDGFVTNVKVFGMTIYQNGNSAPLKVRKLPNKQLWKVYYNKCVEEVK